MAARRGVPARMYVGQRTVLAMTCRICGKLKQGVEYGRRVCKGGSYIDRRCKSCRWIVMEGSLGR